MADEGLKTRNGKTRLQHWLDRDDRLDLELISKAYRMPMSQTLRMIIRSRCIELGLHRGEIDIDRITRRK
jgi:hypothetical protein